MALYYFLNSSPKTYKRVSKLGKLIDLGGEIVTKRYFDLIKSDHSNCDKKMELKFVSTICN